MRGAAVRRSDDTVPARSLRPHDRKTGFRALQDGRDTGKVPVAEGRAAGKQAGRRTT